MTRLAAAALATLLGACADPPAAPRAVGIPRLDAAPATYRLLVSGLDPTVCIAVAGGSHDNGTELITAPCDPTSSAQSFALQPSGVITAYDGTTCFDARGGPNGYGTDGDVVQIWACNAWDNQRWVQTTSQELVTVNGKCLDLWGATATPGAPIKIWTCHGGSNQRWSFGAAAPDEIGGVAELPQSYLDTSLPTVTRRTIHVAAGGALQDSLDAAQPGDELVLAAGATFVGNFVLQPKANTAASQWITVRSDGALPPAGTRVAPSDAAQLAKLLTPNGSPALTVEPSTEGWRLIGLELGPTPERGSQPGSYVPALVMFGGYGAAQDTYAEVPSRIVLDRSYVHASPVLETRRCLYLNSASTAIIDSYFAECHSNGGDSQAIFAVNGQGPFKIVNNHLEGGDEVLVVGGGDPDVPGLIPSDIEIRRNHITRPLSWKDVWHVKNLVEFKAGRRILLEANVFENNWQDLQNGFAFVWWSANADGNALWSVTQDVTFRYNRVHNVASGFNLADRYNASLPPMSRVTIAHNVLTGVGAPGVRGAFGPTVYMPSGGIEGLTIQNNTALSPYRDVLFATTETPLPSLVFRNNVTGGDTYYLQSGMGNGSLALDALQIPAGNVAGNVFVAGGGPGVLPAGNAYAASAAAVGFVDYAGGNLRLAPTSPYFNSSTNGTRPGADIDRIEAMTQGVVR